MDVPVTEPIGDDVPQEDLGEPTLSEAPVTDPSESEQPLVGAQPEETSLEIPAGHVVLVYRGAADTVEYGTYRLRNGMPVVVPSDVAEELLTLPFERFERV